jgi:predicted PilT family ATPase
MKKYLLIDSSFVGKLIGRKGATIQQLRREYKVRISIAKEDEPVSTSGKVSGKF